MFEAYELIFNRRGQAYHRAMQLVPGARRREFLAALEHAGLRRGGVVCDVPSGGGYLADHLPPDLELRLVAIDPSDVFARTWQDQRVEWHLAPLTRLPILHSCVTLWSALPALREMRRVLRPGGWLSITSRFRGATTDRFLNGFVDQYNSMGHDGRFVDDAFRADVTTAGFHVETDELCRYTWDFSGEDEMVEFIRLMFWLDKATPEIILEGVRDILGVDAVGGDCKMNWELQRIIAT